MGSGYTPYKCIRQEFWLQVFLSEVGTSVAVAISIAPVFVASPGPCPTPRRSSRGSRPSFGPAACTSPGPEPRGPSGRADSFREFSPETTGGRARHTGRFRRRPRGPPRGRSPRRLPRSRPTPRRNPRPSFFEKNLDLPLLLRVRARKIVTSGIGALTKFQSCGILIVEGSSGGSHNPFPAAFEASHNPCQVIPELVAFGRQPVAGADRTDPASAGPELISGQRDRGWGPSPFVT